MNVRLTVVLGCAIAVVANTVAMAAPAPHLRNITVVGVTLPSIVPTRPAATLPTGPIITPPQLPPIYSPLSPLPLSPGVIGSGAY